MPDDHHARVRHGRTDRGAARRRRPRCWREVVEQASVEERTDPGLIKEKTARRAAAVLPQAFGTAAVRAARHHGDLTRGRIDRFAPRQRVRRRGAVRRRADLDHRARQLRADRPGVVLQHRRARRAGQLRRPGRRVPRRAVVPAVRLRRRTSIPARAGRHRLALLLVPRRSTPPYTKLTGAALLFALRLSAFLAWSSARSTSSGKAFRAGGYVGDWLAGAAVGVPEPHRLDHRHPDAALPGDHPVDAVLVRPALRARSSQMARRPVRPRASASFARAGARSGGARSSAARCIAKHTKQGRRPRPRPRSGRAAARAAADAGAEAAAPSAGADAADEASKTRRAWSSAAAAALKAASSQPTPPPKVKRCRRRRSRRRCRCRSRRQGAGRAPQGRRTRCRRCALLDAPKTERKIDERELMDGARLLEEKCREFSVEGTVVQIHPGPGRHDLRVQAGRRREVQRRSPASPTTCASRCRPSRC